MALIYRSISLLNTGVVVSAKPSRLVGYALENRAAAERFVKLYNKATAATSADTPVFTITLPAYSGRAHVHLDPVYFSAGISVRCTTGLADNDNTAPTANDVTGHLEYGE